MARDDERTSRSQESPIVGAFCMYNRMVDGLRAPTPPSAEAYRDRAGQIADRGYSTPQITAIPR